jgi:ABC-type uncharacterized transport system substrate-binding protein
MSASPPKATDSLRRAHCESSQTSILRHDILARIAAGVILLGADQMATNIARRKFIAALGGGMVAWPLAARAQQPGKLPTIGFLGVTSPSTMKDFVGAFVQRLHELGWFEGRTVTIEYRWAEGHSERISNIAAEFVRLNVDVIVTQSNTSTAVVKQATSTIPIVFAVAGDPLGTGLVASLARPGGNVTGLSLQATDTAGKRIELLREVVPNIRQLAVMANVGSSVSVLEMREVEAVSHALGLEVAKAEIRTGEDIVPAFEAIKIHANALYVVGDPIIVANRVGISTLAVGAKLPTIANIREFVAAGGLLSYGPNFPDLFRRTADFVDKILKGAKPADLPVEQPSKFDLVVNLTTAKALGLTVPQTLLATADEVIE